MAFFQVRALNTCLINLTAILFVGPGFQRHRLEKSAAAASQIVSNDISTKLIPNRYCDDAILMLVDSVD